MDFKRIGVLIKKDINLFFKNRFFSLITVLGIIFYIVIFFVLPKSVDDRIKIAIFSRKPLSRVYYFLENEDVEVYRVSSIDQLKDMINDEKVSFGIAFPENLKESISKGDAISIKVFVPSSVEKEMREAYQYIAKELAYIELGHSLNIESEEKIIGEDLTGRQIPPSNRIIPIFTLFLILTETLGLSNLIAEEIEVKTIFAILSTPVKVSEVFISKTLVGLITTFIPAIIFITITIGIKGNFPLLVLIILSGSLFTISIGFLVGSISRDFMGVMAYGVLFLIILILPALNVMTPGSFTGWVKTIPSYYLVDALHRVINFGAGFGDVFGYILILLLTGFVLFIIGELAIKRRLV